MGRVPAIRRILPESFTSLSWMPKLAAPINIFMEETIRLFQKNLNFTDNFDGQLITITAEGLYPILIKWDRPSKPTAVWIGGVQRTDGSNISFTVAPFVVWTFNESRQIEISDILGLNDSSTIKYNLTLIGVTG